MRIKVRVLAGTAIAAILMAGSGAAETLDDAVAAAITSNPQLDAAQRVQTEIARETLEQARAGGRTTVSVGGSAGYTYTDTNSPFSLSNGDSQSVAAQVQATKPIYTGGRIAAGVRQATAGINADAQYTMLPRPDPAGHHQFTWISGETARPGPSARQQVANEQERAAKDRFEVGVVTRTTLPCRRPISKAQRRRLQVPNPRLKRALPTTPT
ncbi:MAG: TolC family protein [Hyphomonas sp.]